MAVSDRSPSASENTSIDGVSIAEGCPPRNLNNALRSVMASVRVMYDGLPSTATFAPLNSPEFTGTPKVAARGAVLHHAGTANASGRVFLQPAGQPLPAGFANGDFVVDYVA